MLEFKKLTLSDISLLRPYFSYSKSITCDNTVGGTFMWRDFFKTEYALTHGTLVFKMRYLGKPAFSYPLGPCVREAIYEIGEYCAEKQISTEFCFASENELETYKSLFDCTYSKMGSWSDYIYYSSDLSSFSGRKYNGQRNHVNYFKRTYPDFGYEAITEENLGRVKDFYERFSKNVRKDGELFAHEREKVFEVLENYSLYAMTGGLLTAGGEVVAFAAGEKQNDTLFVHIEKADANVRGAYQTMVLEFSRAASCGAKYINREDDSGDEGLRISKLSYHPCIIAEKYKVVKNEGN